MTQKRSAELTNLILFCLAALVGVVAGYALLDAHSIWLFGLGMATVARLGAPTVSRHD